MVSASISAPIKHRKEFSGAKTIGSPRTLKLVFISIGQPVRDLNTESNL
jgi:hypothetical protein